MATGVNNFADFLENLDSIEFSPAPYYEHNTDALILYLKDTPSYSKRINKLLTLFISNDKKELVGVEIKGFKRMLEVNRKGFGIAYQDKSLKLGLFLWCAISSDSPEDPDTLEHFSKELLEYNEMELGDLSNVGVRLARSLEDQ